MVKVPYRPTTVTLYSPRTSVICSYFDCGSILAVSMPRSCYFALARSQTAEQLSISNTFTNYPSRTTITNTEQHEVILPPLSVLLNLTGGETSQRSDKRFHAGASLLPGVIGDSSRSGTIVVADKDSKAVRSIRDIATFDLHRVLHTAICNGRWRITRSRRAIERNRHSRNGIQDRTTKDWDSLVDLTEARS
jgi:hypothetical protein